MSILIVNNLPEADEEAKYAIRKLTDTGVKTHVVHALELNISNCTSCKTCMFKTPGVCCKNDDYKKIEELIMEYDNVIFISGTSLNFLDHRTIKFFERFFPFLVILCELRNGEVRQFGRYKKPAIIGVLYTGTADNSMLNEWLDLYTSHGNSMSLGAFHINDVEELCKCIS